jgi:hypothetical protein
MRTSRPTPYLGIALVFASALALGAPAAAGGGAACIEVFHAHDSVKSYRAVQTRTRNGGSTTSTIDIVKPDRAHMISPRIEMIVIGNRMWRRMGGTAWQTATPGIKGTDILSTMQIHTENFGGSCSDAGMGMWRGHPAHIFKGTYVTPSGTQHATAYLFGDGLVHHVDMTLSGGGTMSMDLSNFNTTSVNPPR